MITFDDSFLEEVGLKELPADDRSAFLKHAREVLEMRLGESLSKGLADDLLTEFFSHVQQGRPEKALAWLRRNVPGYSRIVQDEIARLKAEIKADAPRILEHARKNSA